MMTADIKATWTLPKHRTCVTHRPSLCTKMGRVEMKKRRKEEDRGPERFGEAGKGT